MATILVTGAAGFIGYHVAERLLADGHDVIGLDIVNDYYDVRLKEARLSRLHEWHAFSFHKLDLGDRDAIHGLVGRTRPEFVVNLAAQAGVRYSLDEPEVYVHANLVGFLNILEACRHNAVRHLLYASSSSIYGANTAMPFSEGHDASHPVSLYAATKRANELMAHAYSHLFGLPTTGLRFFTVYGPWGRPDMALFKFAKAILSGQPIEVYNYGNMQRDFTYVDDVVEGITRLIPSIPTADAAWRSEAPDPGTGAAPYRVYNIGNSSPVDLMEMIGHLEAALGREATKTMLPMQMGDVPKTWADVSRLEQAVGYRPQTSPREGVARFAEWYLAHYGG